MKQSKFPPGWNEERVKKVLAHYESQSEDEAVAEDEAAEELWDSIVADSAAIPLTQTQRDELDRRIADHEANPDDVVSWEEVKTSITERLKK